MKKPVYVVTRVLSFMPGGSIDTIKVGNGESLVATGAHPGVIETFIHEMHDSEHTIIAPGGPSLYEKPLIHGTLIGVVFNEWMDGDEDDALGHGITGHTSAKLKATEFIVMYDEMPSILI